LSKLVAASAFQAVEIAFQRGTEELTQTLRPMAMDYDPKVPLGSDTYLGILLVGSSSPATPFVVQEVLPGGPAAGKMKTTAQDVSMLEYTMTATQDVEVRSTKVYVCWDDTGDGDYDVFTSAVQDDITDVKLLDADTNGVLAGPIDGSSFTIDSSNSVCGDTATPIYYTWTDYYDTAVDYAKRGWNWVLDRFEDTDESIYHARENALDTVDDARYMYDGFIEGMDYIRNSDQHAQDYEDMLDSIEEQ